MDVQLDSAASGITGTGATAGAATAAAAALAAACRRRRRSDMPPQDLRYKPSRRARHASGAAVLYARFILIAVTVGVTTYGVYQMLQVVRFASMTRCKA